MNPYDEVETGIRLRQELLLSWASRERARRPGGGGRPRGARVHLAQALRRLAAWIDGSGSVAGSVTLRPS